MDEGSDDMPAPDYANDAGNHIEEYDYPDDPEPAESIVSTLCNLNQEYLGSLRATQGAAPVVDEDLRMNVLSLSDLLGYWDTLREHYPEAAPAIDTAQQIHDLWDEALLGTENGDDAAASTAMLEAERLLEDLPTVEVETCAH